MFLAFFSHDHFYVTLSRVNCSVSLFALCPILFLEKHYYKLFKVINIFQKMLLNSLYRANEFAGIAGTKYIPYT